MPAWKQGEHVVIIGQTGSGKTWLARKLLAYRKHKIVILTKTDNSYWAHYKRVVSADQINSKDHASFILYPEYRRQWQQIASVLMKAWTEEAWCVYLDETYYIQHELGLEKSISMLLTQGRSKAITMVCGIQRPAWVTRLVFSEPTHLFCFKFGDRRDLKALQEGVGTEYASVVDELGEHQFAYYNKQTRKTITGRAENLTEILGEAPNGR